MPGIGKTYWSKQLEKKGFMRFCCDDLIERKLQQELKPLRYTGIHDVAKWMGQPYETHYQTRSRQYLFCEEETIHEILEKIQTLPKNVNVVVDTTGSVIYLNGSAMQKLSTFTKIIYLDTPSSIKEAMYEAYLKDPKPVIWEHMFEKKQGETNENALKRCYPKLLKHRTAMYKKYAKKTIDYFMVRNSRFTVERLIKFLEKP